LLFLRRVPPRQGRGTKIQRMGANTPIRPVWLPPWACSLAWRRHCRSSRRGASYFWDRSGLNILNALSPLYAC
jgi:hypothetical protein